MINWKISVQENEVEIGRSGRSSLCAPKPKHWPGHSFHGGSDRLLRSSRRGRLRARYAREKGRVLQSSADALDAEGAKGRLLRWRRCRGLLSRRARTRSTAGAERAASRCGADVIVWDQGAPDCELVARAVLVPAAARRLPKAEAGTSDSSSAFR